jgi:hypothetical protein
MYTQLNVDEMEIFVPAAVVGVVVVVVRSALTREATNTTVIATA